MNQNTNKSTESNSSSLLDLQEQLDLKYGQYAKVEFENKLNHHKSILSLLEKRDKMLRDMPKDQWLSFLNKAISNFDNLHDFLPIVTEDSKSFYDTSFIKFLKVDYLDNFKMKVVFEFYENPYIQNLYLEKNYDLFSKDENAQQIKYKTENNSCELFEYFGSDEENLEAFDIFYEFYVNLVYYSFYEGSDSEEECCEEECCEEECCEKGCCEEECTNKECANKECANKECTNKECTNKECTNKEC